MRWIAGAAKWVAVGDRWNKNTFSEYHSVYCCFNYKHWSRSLINIQLPPFIKAEWFASFKVFHTTAAQRAWAQLMVTQMLCSLCIEQQSVCSWGSNSIGNVSCQQTVNNMWLKLTFSALQYRWMLYSYCWLW